VKSRFLFVSLVIAVCVGLGGLRLWLQVLEAKRTAPLETAHYVVTSTATAEQTQLVAQAVERLYLAYAGFFDLRDASNTSQKKLRLILYQDRDEFVAHNTSAPWA
jgi:hypothetical protein